MWPDKDPDEFLDYQLDWSARLASGETISTSTWTFDAGNADAALIKSLPSIGSPATTTKIWLDVGTLGLTYKLINSVVTSGSREMDQTVRIRIRTR